MTEKLLPLGTIVYLKEGTAKLMIVGRGASFEDEEGQKFTDYIGVIYPNGIDPQDALFFNHEDIDKIVFVGYSDEEETRFLEVYEEWKKNLEESKKEENHEINTFGF
ncbi:DUF4176 domain-containing protein [Enterococcus faecium]|uniref:DUF4176 domain-containing protein n=1 Tax=Enterococcus hirae TaxID=1354 RepID=UPI001A08BFC7|nr:DUF4176 domain-containing protein [Enterococcus hirae]EGO8095111.1 DUF4176 domain-containing protein [Enterococcus faecalis]EME8275060.1 DUF4176 domain-containing protein [Enterococcus faecium]EHK9412247.1 DUF4176 domain-containing protein [Enterococcus faecalis]EHQ8833469.1 DUF4176 domain-containing protein [Enterococcus faecalis]EIP8062067.1 DUF4176 domain-containing protein [Enterococcus faecalis]